MEMEPKHVRHKPQTALKRPRSLVLVCPQFRSGVNLSRIVRLAGCAGIQRIVACGQTKVDPKIARDALETVTIERHRSLTTWLQKNRTAYGTVVALEQSDRSESLFRFNFPQDSVLLIGHERLGIPDQQLALADHVVEIPVYGRPFSYNVATAATMAVYEYCRQYPDG